MDGPTVGLTDGPMFGLTDGLAPLSALRRDVYAAGITDTPTVGLTVGPTDRPTEEWT